MDHINGLARMVIPLVISQGTWWALLQELTQLHFCDWVGEIVTVCTCSVFCKIIIALSLISPKSLTFVLKGFKSYIKQYFLKRDLTTCLVSINCSLGESSFYRMEPLHYIGVDWDERYFPLDTSLEYLSPMCPDMNNVFVGLRRLLSSGVREGTWGCSWRNSLWSSVKPLHGFSV